MFQTRKQLLARIERLEHLVHENTPMYKYGFDYACAVCKYGVYCPNGDNDVIIACVKKLPERCADFTLDESYCKNEKIMRGKE